MFENITFCDLTHVLHENIPTWTGSCGFKHAIKRDYDSGIRVMKYALHGSAGTHIDAPSHFYKEGKDIADLCLQDLITPYVLIDVSCKIEPTLQIELKDIEEFEIKHGPILPSTFVIGFTGWGRYWNEPSKYRNEQSGKLVFPTFSFEAVAYLNTKKISGIGIDTLSPDPSDSDHPVHRLLLGEGKYIVENMAHLEKLKARRGMILILPLKISGGAEAPLRVIAAINKEIACHSK
jgi:kynurenine formamidase